MKKLLIITLSLLALVACKDNKATNETSSNETQTQTPLSDGDEYEKNDRHCIYREPLSLTSDDGSMAVAICLTPDFSLPPVHDKDYGLTYCDNRAEVCVTYHGDTIMNQDFTKASLSTWTDANIAPRAILNNMTFRGFNPNGLRLEAEVSVPHSDEECYVVIDVDTNGGVNIYRYEDEAVPEELVTE